MSNRAHASKPPWWPEDDPWPPPDGRGRTRSIFRWILFLGLLVLVLVIALSVVAGFFFAERGGDRQGPPPFVGLFFLLLIVGVFVVAARAFRRFSNPLGQVMSSLDELAIGHYDTRVSPSGPPPVRALGEALNTTAARLEAAEELRQNLVADITHEVRTPLAVIRVNAEGMLDGMYEVDATRLGAIVDEVGVITRLVEDLSTLSSADAGVLQIHREPTDLAELLREVAMSFSAEAATKEVVLLVSGESSPLVVEVDTHRIRQVLENLVTNSLRHTGSRGSIRLVLNKTGEAAEVVVADNGSGIAADELEHIFERYRKGADSEGSGLGLAIARRLVEAHDGTIKAVSEPGVGTTVSFSLPKVGG